MCGIVGIFHYRDRERLVSPRLIGAMTRSLAHRGPDGEGVWTAPAIALGHRRLAILDLTDAARQPMINDPGNAVITYNGEIYNFRDLRKELEGSGHRFQSSGDTEVILAGYREWGAGLLTKLSGIFAFAIWDLHRQRLFLARDPIGVKPLFYSDDGTSFRFGSEIKAILTDPEVSREYDEEALDAFFTFGYSPAPATGFRYIRQLLPGFAGFVTNAGFSFWRYWENPFSEEPRKVKFSSALSEFSDLIDRVTKCQMVSDVGVGAFLSGGLDSAAVVRAMKRADMGSVQAFCVGFEEPGFDERERARATARSLGVRFKEQKLHLDAASLLPSLSLHLEEPTADSSVLPVYLLCKAASKNFTVAMAGDGADELLAGYETYRASNLAAYYRQIPYFIRRWLLRPLALSLPVSDQKYSFQQMITRFTYGAELGPDLDHCSWRIIFTDAVKRRLYEAKFLQKTRENLPFAQYAEYIREIPERRGPLSGRLNADMKFYLPNDMLVKVDRMSMANGLEVRVPLLDIELVRFCSNLPDHFKLFGGKVRKHILRESLRGSVPEKVLKAPKSGFNIPLGKWMRGTLCDLLMDAVSDVRDEIGRFLDCDELQRVIEEHRCRRADHGYVLFTVLMFALWLNNGKRSWKYVC